jgi:hypothetical protein
LDNKIRYFEYVNTKLKRKNFINIVLPGLIIVLSFLVAFIEVWVVKHYYLFGIPQNIAEYMLYTSIRNFNYFVFRGLAIAYNLSKGITLLLVFIYYSSIILNYIFILVMFILSVRIFSYSIYQRENKSKITFCRLMLLDRYLKNFFIEPQKTIIDKAIKLVKSLDLSDTISPFKENWQKKPNFSWFNQNLLNRDTKRILASLKAFKKKALSCLYNHYDLPQLQNVVDEITTFQYLTNFQEKISYDSSDVKIKPEQEFKQLLKFSNDLSRIQVLKIKGKQKPSRIASFFTNFIIVREFRLILAFSLIAGVVMAIGAIVFRIPKSQAFLYWFVVVFGSTLLSTLFRK